MAVLNRARAAGRDGGSATVWLLSLGMLGCVVFTATLAVGAAVAARRRRVRAAK